MADITGTSMISFFMASSFQMHFAGSLSARLGRTIADARFS
ncbi:MULTISPECIES: hypothetical protein [unclassified Mesorhizobium]